MDEPRYDIYFTGQLIEGTAPEHAQKTLAQLFNTSVDNIASLFNGKPQALKRNVNKAEALKYKATLHKAGMMVAFKAHQASSNKTSENNDKTKQISNDEGWTLAPVGSDVLTAEEKQHVPESNIDTSMLSLSSPFTKTEEHQTPPPPAPDTSHISAAAVGEDLLLEHPKPPTPPEMDLDSISLAPPGSDLEELHQDTQPLNPDLSHISMADVGADILTEKKRHSAAAHTKH